ncbi:DAK2 domain-containing protein [Actinoplanes sp. NPDC051851]|uniref:DAK2 domain-containing protein n=1 Tax=Actinoplanes sp. NPDC051851 TaxID=3154753 RepID=UPI0034175063
MLETLDAAAVHRWCDGGLEALRAHQREIDELNVYPVPDGDTGTNLVLTLTAAREALEEPDALDAAPQVSGAPEPGGPGLDAPGLGAPGLGAPGLDAPGVGAPGVGAAGSGTVGATAGAGSAGVASPGTVGVGPGAASAGAGGAAASVGESGRVMRRMARGALLGARGNSGVIVSQILRGMADSFATAVAVRGPELARAFRTASEAAYAAVATPVEGTVLSVVAAAAEGAARIASDDLVAVARAAASAASEALARTPQQLPVLALAGVVDAGGRGLCVLLDALVAALTESDAIDPDSPSLENTLNDEKSVTKSGDASAVGVSVPGTGVGTVGTGVGAGAMGVGTGVGTGVGVVGTGVGVVGTGVGTGHQAEQGDCSGDGRGYGFEVQYLLDAEPEAVAELRAVLGGLGESLVIVGTGDGAPPTWNVHVHVPVTEIGAAVEAGVGAGRAYRISVTQLEARRPESGARGAVVVASGDGLTALFETEGATVVDRNPSTAEILAAIRASGAGDVVLLPNDANTQTVAIAAAREAEAEGIRVSVVPTRSPVQALAALAVRDRQRPFSDDVIAMAEAAGACRYGEVCTAQRDALTVAGPCRAGDLLGLVDGEVHVIGADLAEVSHRLLDRMLGGGGELVTLVLGADAPPDLEGALRGHVHRTWPFIELQCYAGGQPRYHLLAGVE